MQAPQSPASQPILVPVSPRRSRSVPARLANGSAATATASPLTLKRTLATVCRGVSSITRCSARSAAGSRRSAETEAAPRDADATGFPSPLAPMGFPSPSCRRHVFDMTRGGVRGGGSPDPRVRREGAKPPSTWTPTPLPSPQGGGEESEAPHINSTAGFLVGSRTIPARTSRTTSTAAAARKAPLPRTSSIGASVANWLASTRSDAAANGWPSSARSSSGSRCATAEQAPTATRAWAIAPASSSASTAAAMTIEITR